jgi:hypothetical protein
MRAMCAEARGRAAGLGSAGKARGTTTCSRSMAVAVTPCDEGNQVLLVNLPLVYGDVCAVEVGVVERAVPREKGRFGRAAGCEPPVRITAAPLRKTNRHMPASIPYVLAALKAGRGAPSRRRVA